MPHWKRRDKRDNVSKEVFPVGKFGDPETMTGHSVRRWHPGCCRPGSSPVDQHGQAQPADGFRLFIDGGEGGLDRSFGDLEIERNFKVGLALGHQFGNLELPALVKPAIKEGTAP